MTADVVVWQDVECGGYAADLPLWLELAERAGGPVLDVGAGSGRVALELARAGHAVTALDHVPELLAALRERAGDLSVSTVLADARDFDLAQRFALCIVPMQTVQVLGGEAGRAAFLGRARAHLEDGGLLAAALADVRDAAGPGDGAGLPVPDVRERDGWLYSSQPLGVRLERGAAVLERLRETVAPDGTRTVVPDAIRLDQLTAAQLATQARAVGFEPLSSRSIPATEDHVGSEVVVLRA